MGQFSYETYWSGENAGITATATSESDIALADQANNPSSEAINNAVIKLTRAIGDFKASRIEQEPVDKSKLAALIQNVNGKYNEKLYTPESWKVFIQALNAAKGVNTNENAVQADVTNAISALEAAIRGLKPVEVKPVPVDKTALKNLYQSCASLKSPTTRQLPGRLWKQP